MTKTCHMSPFYATLFGFVSLTSLASVTAQEAVDNSVDNEASDKVLDTIVVQGYRDSLASSLALKRNANQVIDAITAESIGQFPDQNLAEAIQRVPGVQITRSNGEGEQVNIRGLSANFTRVEIDGRTANVTIDSADPGRASTLSVFASDLYNTIEVIKSPTAADIEGGVGGIVRLKTPNPLDIGKRTFGFEGGVIQADQRDDTEPQFTGFYSDVFNEKLGVLVAFTYEDRDQSIDKIQNNQGWEAVDASLIDDASDVEGAFFPTRIRLEERDQSAEKLNFNGKLQFRATEELILSLDGLYTQESRDRQQARIQAQFGRNRANGLVNSTANAGSNTLLTGDFNRVRVEPISFARDTDIETFGLSGGFEWTPENWTMSGEVNFSSSEEDFNETRASSRENRNVSFSIANDPEYPELTFEDGAFDLADWDIRQLDTQQRIISIEETSARFDAERALSLGVISSVTGGLRYASTEFDRKQGQISSPSARDLTFADGTPGFVNSGDFADGFGGTGLLRIWPSIDPVALYNQFPGDGDFFDNANADENLYDFTEDVLAGYSMANFDDIGLGGSWTTRGNFGVRVVQTKYDGTGAVDLAGDAVNDFGNIGTQSVDRDYTDIMPSLNFVVSPSADSDFQIRAAVTRALSRPNISDIQPGLVVRVDALREAGDDTVLGTADDILAEVSIETGNPEVDPFRAWQYDLGFEWYFGPEAESAVTAALFYKDVENFVTTTNISTSFVTSTLDQAALTSALEMAGVTDGFNDIDFDGNIAVNGGTAEFFGFELGFQTPFYFLPGFWSDFGIFANYTYTDAEATDPDGNKGPFPGASENAVNLTGYYERGGFSGRLSWVYRDDFFVEPDSATSFEFNDTDGRLDLALRYYFDNGLRLSFDALNLTEEQNFKYYDVDNRLEDIEVEGRIYQFSAGYKF